MEISYKIPKGYMALLLGAGAFLPLGTFGYLDDSFRQTSDAQWISLTLFFGALLYFCITPRNRKIVASETGIAVPYILLPPYTTKRCRWKDVIRHRVKYDKHGNETLILKTESGKIRIHSLLCFKDYEMSFTSNSYEALYAYIIEKLNNQNNAN